MRNQKLTDAIVYYFYINGNPLSHTTKIKESIEKIQGFPSEQSSVTSTLRRGSVNRKSGLRPKILYFRYTKGNMYELINPNSQDVKNCIDRISNSLSIKPISPASTNTSIVNNNPVVSGTNNKLTSVNINSNLKEILKNIYSLDKDQLLFISNLAEEILKDK